MVRVSPTDQLLGKAGNEAGPADLDRHVLGRAALEGLAADAADEIDDQRVAFGGRARLGDLNLLPAAAQNIGKPLLHGVRRRLRLEPCEADFGEIRDGYVGEHLKLQGELQVIGLPARDQIDLGLHGGAKTTLRKQLAGRLVDRLIGDLGHDG
jgi:hypothetical protein